MMTAAESMSMPRTRTEREGSSLSGLRSRLTLEAGGAVAHRKAAKATKKQQALSHVWHCLAARSGSYRLWWGSLIDDKLEWLP